LFADGSFKTGGATYLRPSLAVTTGDGMNVFTPDHGGLKLGGRVDFLPFGLFTNFGQFREADIVRELTPKLVIGATYSHNSGMSSRRGRESGAILYLNEAGEESLPNYTKYGLDFMFKYKGVSVLGEWVGSSATVPDDITQRVRTDGSIATTFEIDGEQNVENYVKNRMMLGKGYNIQAGYVFKKLVSIDARYCHLDADQYSFLNNGTFYNRPNYYTLGFTKYFYRGYGLKVQASMTYVEAAPGSNDNAGIPMNGNEWIGRLVTTISF
ncbi:MAG: porin, partial [Bacteroidales bacterium]|nr:porin [Bacteroidales bacterium]